MEIHVFLQDVYCIFLSVHHSFPNKLRQFVLDLHSGKLHREFHHGPDPTDSTPGQVREQQTLQSHWKLSFLCCAKHDHLFCTWLLPSGGDGRWSGQQPPRELFPKVSTQRDSLHHPPGPWWAVTSAAFQWTCDSMPRPGVREGVRVGTGQWDRTATPNTLTEEWKIDRWGRGSGGLRGRRRRKRRQEEKRGA